jgi:outer membrane lipopolysaccharide assembly protein LptE/RlpB
MTRQLTRLALVAAVSAIVSACGLGLRSPNISELKDNPGRYHDRSVSIDGVVTSSWGVPLVPYRMYKVDDGTGEVTVLSNNSRSPTRGAKVHVKGKVNDVGVLGGRALGLHLREEKLDIRRGN